MQRLHLSGEKEEGGGGASGWRAERGLRSGVLRAVEYEKNTATVPMSDSGGEDDEERQHANIAAWIANKHAEEQEDLARSDLFPWVLENQLYMPGLARGIQLNGQAPWIYQNFRTYFGQSDRAMHRSNQMADTDLDSYMVENSFIVRNAPVGEPSQNRWEFRLAAVKILCKRNALAGASPDEHVWSPYSYTNHWDDDRSPFLWIHYPTGETRDIVNYDVDTCANHKRAVEAAMNADEPIDFMICVMDYEDGRNVAVQHVFSKARVVDAWRETDEGDKKVAMYQIKVCPADYNAPAA